MRKSNLLGSLTGLWFLLLGLLVQSPTAVAQGAPDLAQLEPTLVRFLEGASVNDAAVHQAFWHTDLVYTSASGKRFGKAQLMADVVSSGPRLEAADSWSWYSHEQLQVTPVGNALIIHFRLVAHSETNAGYSRQDYLNSGVMVWQDERWQALHWQATVAASE